MPIYPSVSFNNNPVIQVSSQKHLGLLLDSKLNFTEHLTLIFNKVNKNIGLLRKLQPLLPRSSLLTIYKSFIRPHLDYGDVIYDQAFNQSFHEKIETIQYNAALAITSAIRGSSRENLCQELVLEFLYTKVLVRKLSLIFKIIKNEAPAYLFNLIPKNSSCRCTRSANNISLIKHKHNFYKNSFFPSVIIEWNNLDLNIRNSEAYLDFRNNILKFIRPSQNSIFNIHNPYRIKLLTRLRLGLSHLNDRKVQAWISRLP